MSRSERRKFNRNQKKGNLVKKESNYSTTKILIFIFFSLLLRIMIQSKTIGEEYILYLTITPIILGLTALGFYKRKFLKESLQETTSWVEKITISFFYCVQGIIYSYLSIGLIVNISWVAANNYVAKNSIQEFYSCKITGLNSPSRRAPSLWYEFKNNPELCYISNEQFYFLEKGNWKKNTINLTVRKGIGNCYILDNLEIY